MKVEMDEILDAKILDAIKRGNEKKQIELALKEIEMKILDDAMKGLMEDFWKPTTFKQEIKPVSEKTFTIKTTYGNFTFPGDVNDTTVVEAAKESVRNTLGMGRLPNGTSVVDGGTTSPSPSVSPKIVMPEEWQLAEAILPHARRIFICGKPGISKTYWANNYGLETPGGGKREVYNVTMHEESDPSMLMGHYVLTETGGMTFRYGYGAAAMLKPWSRLVINEITRASGPTLSMCFALLDDPENNRITLDNGETITPSEGFQVICTDNGSVKDLPPALEDRFEVILEIANPHPDAIEALPEDLRNAARGTVGHTNPDQAIGLRKWITFSKLRENMDEVVAAHAVFGKARAKDIVQSLKLSK